MADIVELTGSIFDSKCQTIVNTVNCKGYMGKGLALEFKYRFPDMFEEYKAQCMIGEITTGKLTLWNKSTPFIINFPTKDDWKFHSKIEYIETGLQYFVEHCKAWGITSIAFPKLGTNQGKLDWLDVKTLLFDYLEDLDLKVEIYEFNEKFQDKLFISLMTKIKGMPLQYYIDRVGLYPQKAVIFKDAVDDNSILSFYSIQKLPGLGEKSIEKIYAFALKKSEFIQTQLP